MNAVLTNISINPTIPKMIRIHVLEDALIINSTAAITAMIALTLPTPMNNPYLIFCEFSLNSNPGDIGIFEWVLIAGSVEFTDTCVENVGL